jgi:putative tryptophan/tyrosine transport system substrate-binding protein
VKRWLQTAALLISLGLIDSLDAQQRKPARIGVMVTGERGLNLLRQGLGERGYVEGKNLDIIYRYVQGNTDRMPDVVSEILANNVDVLVVSNTTAIRAAQKATKAVPIVMMTNQDPVTIGLVESLARPDGNLTGVVSLTRDLSGKRLEVLKEAVPKTNHVGVIWVQPTALGAGNAFRNFEIAAKTLKLRLTSLQAQRPTPDVEGLFRAADKARVDSIISVTNAVINQHIKTIAHLAMERRLPLMGEGSTFVDEGALISYAANDADRFLRAAIFVDKILKGAKPGELPIERAMKFELVINLKTAKQIGLTIPPNVLGRADKVIR